MSDHFNSIYQAEYAVQNLIKNDNNCSAHFVYHSVSDSVTLDLVTYNPIHNTHFLLHSLNGKTQIDCIAKMYNHVFEMKASLKEHSPYFLSYTIEWYSPMEQKKITSSFYGKNLDEILLKFNYGKTEKLVIHNITLNGES